MEITSFGPDDAAELVAWAELANAVDRHDSPWRLPHTAKSGAARFRYGWDCEPVSPYLARLDGEVVGWGSISISEYDNLDLAWLEVQVHPRHRRRGVGTALLETLVGEARRRGRTSLGIDAWESEVSDAFAQARGFDRRLASVNRRQMLADVDWAELQRRYDAALPHAAGYVVERWSVPTPDERLGELAEMASAINDAPLDDLAYEDEVFTAERMRNYETAVAGHDQRLYRLVARHAPSGAPVAQTVVVVWADHPAWGDQHDTSVIRAHRGHRLGLILKIEMLRWLAEAEPQLQVIDTWNAESNGHMIGVNEALGYRVMGREWAYQRAL